MFLTSNLHYNNFRVILLSFNKLVRQLLYCRNIRYKAIEITSFIFNGNYFKQYLINLFEELLLKIREYFVEGANTTQNHFEM